MTTYNRRQFLRMAAATAGGGLLAMTQLDGIAEACQKAQWSNTDLQLDETLLAQATPAATAGLPQPVQTIQAKDFSHLQGTVEGISWNQLEQHIGLYNNYVKTLNTVQDQLAQAARGGNTADLRQLMLTQSYALDGAILHDLYFSNMGSTTNTPGELTARYLSRDFGGTQNFITQFEGVGAKMRGWAVAGLNMLDGKIHVYGLDAHDEGTPMGVYPLLIMDVYEHAYMIDFGTNRGRYLEVFRRNIDWTEVEQRLQSATAMYAARMG